MRPPALLRPIQVAWLNEIGVDLHGLRQAAEASPQRARTPPQADARLPQPAAAPAAPASPSVVESVDVESVDVEAVDVEALARVVRACQGCALHAQRAQAVPGAGVTRQPAWFIVGEQPGIEDDALGRPFQGDQGRLLAAMLAAARLPQADSLYATHVVKCRAVGGREPTPAEVAACLPYLQREIALLRPLRILALGRVAAQAVLGSTADLDALRGRPHAYRAGPDDAPIPVWVTHQPSALLVRSADKAEAWRDLVALRRFVLETQG